MNRKEWLLKNHGIGNGGGKGRISAEGHRLINEAISNGVVFDEPLVSVSKNKTNVLAPATRPVYDPAAVRLWASKNGQAVGKRGRIDGKIVDAYLAATETKDRPVVDSKTTRAGIKDLRQESPRRYPQDAKLFAVVSDGKRLPVPQKEVCYCGYSLSNHLCNRPQKFVSTDGYFEWAPIVEGLNV